MNAEAKKVVYSADFFLHRAAGSSKSAQVVVPLVLSELKVGSVVDVGCGTGTWTAEFLANGVTDVTGIDGDYIDRSTLLIPASRFDSHDLNRRIDFDRTFDLAVCLEVAEHLPASRAAGLASDLTRLAPCVLFSAAIPGQLGTKHINEQPLQYWVKLFSQLGYTCSDSIRHVIWDNEDVDWWYRQNIVYFAREGHPILKADSGRALNLVHPMAFDFRRAEIDALNSPTLGFLLRALPGAVRRSVRTRLQKLLARPDK